MTDPVDNLVWRLAMMSVFRSISEKAQHAQVLIMQVKSIKLKTSEEYFEERKDLNRFLLQCDLYVWHNQIQFQTENEFMFTVTYLQRDAFIWIQTHLKNFFRNSGAKWEDIINEIFDSFSEFKKHIQIVFKDIDVE